MATFDPHDGGRVLAELRPGRSVYIQAGTGKKQ